MLGADFERSAHIFEILSALVNGEENYRPRQRVAEFVQKRYGQRNCKFVYVSTEVLGKLTARVEIRNT